MTTLSLFRRHPDPAEELDEIETYAEAFHVPAGTVVMQQGEPAGGFFVVLSGEFSVLLETESCGVSLGRLGPGACFGATDLLQTGVHGTTVRAATDGELVVLGERELRAILDDAAITGVDLSAAAAAFVNLLDWEPSLG
jgi:ATP-binding cassette subfamily B protein